MSSDIKIFDAVTIQDLSDVKTLFLEYAKSLNFDLCFQGFDEELNTLPGKYSMPDGFILLAKYEQKIAGCVTLRKLESGICEMKRLFVRPEFRGKNIGRILSDELILRAKTMGYTKMRLDTIKEQMKDAIRLYVSYGFFEIESYYHNPQEGVVYMELML